MNQLNQYIIALTYLYGIAPVDMIVQIYNEQNEDQVSIEQVADMVDEPIDELWKAFVFGHEGYFVHETILAFDEFDRMMMLKADKPYYIPQKEELLKYAHEGYFEENRQFKTLLQYIQKHFISDEARARELVDEIHGMIQVEANMKIIMDTLNNFGVEYRDMTQVNETMKRVMDFANNIRIWQNNGHTPHEILERYEKPKLKPFKKKPFDADETNVIDLKSRKKIGRNDPCPCGSGKKFKKCCLDKEERS